MTATAAFDPNLVTITRKRFSVTQGEVLVEYAGGKLGQYGDKIEFIDGEWKGYDDSFWMDVAKREAAKLGLAAATFEAGKTYWTRSIVDADHVVSIDVLSRTAKTLRVRTGGKEKTLRVSPSYEGHESVKPWGSYSMCPVITAEKVAA